MAVFVLVTTLLSNCGKKKINVESTKRTEELAQNKLASTEQRQSMAASLLKRPVPLALSPSGVVVVQKSGPQPKSGPQELRPVEDKRDPPTLVVLPSDGWAKLDNTKIEHAPPCHERAYKAAAEGTIIKPDGANYRGNIDEAAATKDAQARREEIEKALDNKSDNSGKAQPKNKRVKIAENRCIVYETNEMGTAEDNDDVGEDPF